MSPVSSVLVSEYGRVPLGSWPTPLEPAPRLARALGLYPDDLWIKRDDLSGLGGGGNKVRKLEYTCALALAAGADTLVTTGAAQSNHARLTAAAGARLGLEVVLVLAGDPPAAPAGNLLLDGLFGATVRWAGVVDDAGLTRAADVAVAERRESGSAVALIPFGGSNALGALGYVDAADEILMQEPDLDHLVVAVGSGGTMAGLVHGLGARRVQGVDTGAVDDPVNVVTGLLAGLRDGAFDDQLRIRRDQVGTGYADFPEAVRRALWLAARTEGIVLDPVYTGRALAGLGAAVADGDIRPGERTVFLHSGGLPGFFGSAAAAAYVADLNRTS